MVPFRSPLLRESLLLSFPLATKMFQFARLSLACPWIQQQFERLTYSGISVSMLIFNSPKHLVAYYALPHLWVPRYPPSWANIPIYPMPDSCQKAQPRKTQYALQPHLRNSKYDAKRRTLQGLDMPRILLKESGAFGNTDTGGAWMSSARVVRLPVISRRKVRMTSSHHAPYALGNTRATMAGTKGPARVS
ncbi:hypothetical protein E3N88_18062 [Mikania micrantha]|uniref:Uncharacterized protein n=1 Tax=Mikania micrantha TaxID=192012 RepID=A0A5N6NTT3_9ASTR|nr:hypothetical protein E3N88_18062 [Mikania micrantha]